MSTKLAVGASCALLLLIGSGIGTASAADTFCAPSAHEPIISDNGVDPIGHITCSGEDPYVVTGTLCLQRSVNVLNSHIFGDEKCEPLRWERPDGGVLDDEPIFYVGCDEMTRAGLTFRSKFTAHWNIPDVSSGVSAVESLLTSQTTYSRPIAYVCDPPSQP